MSFYYISKPVIVQAFHLAKLESDETQKFPSWLMPAITKNIVNLTDSVCQTRQGPVSFKSDDWLIRLDDGEIYPCSNEVFISKYQPCAEAA